MEWAQNREDIRAVLVVGSTARLDHPDDEWSDLDLLFFTSQNTLYHRDTEWLYTIGTLWLSVPNPRSDGCPEYLVIFKGGHKVDFLFFPMTELDRLIHSHPLPNAYHRGYQVLVDKDGLAAKIPSSPFATPRHPKPDETAFNAAVNNFWYAAFRIARSIGRRDLWVVKLHDRSLKDHLLTMLEWHARVRHGWEYDTWHSGRFMCEWVDPATRAEVQRTFGGFDARECWRALRASMELFRRLAAETAPALGYTYPIELDANISQCITQLQTDDKLAAES
jgi:aminoglycoside 6-adenylyltransferase